MSVICEVSEVITVCMFCIMVSSISVPNICLLLRQTSFSLSLKSILIYIIWS
jgi:hypothetical protein